MNEANTMSYSSEARNTTTSGGASGGGPSLENATPLDWERHAGIAYIFARHARHDLANIHCALNMLEVVERVQLEAGAEPLPPELDPVHLKAKMRGDVKRLVSTSNDLVLISQATNRGAYRGAQTLTGPQLIEAAILNRGVEPAGALPELLAAVEQLSVVSLGDMLAAAISAFYFQWTPWLIPNDRAVNLSFGVAPDRLTLAIPADDTESIASFARRLTSSECDPLASIPEGALAITTTELALWLARFIVVIHGGTVTAHPDDPTLSVRITVPTVRA
jgi:hypothetical protein